MLNLNKFLPFSNDYIVRIDGSVLDVHSGTVPVKVIDGTAYVELDWVNGRRDYELGLVTLIAFKGLELPAEHYSSIEVRYTDGDKTNVTPDNLYYTYTAPIECADHPGHYYIPYLNRYVISLAGELIDRQTGSPRRWHIKKPSSDPARNKKNIRGGYRVTNGINDKGNGINLSRHRSMALAFKQPFADPATLVVNHLDGVGGRDGLDNLEWATRSTNTQHAYDMGLQPNNVRAVLVKDVKTGEILRYDSMAACCRATEIKHPTLVNRLKNNPGKAYSNGYAYKLDDDSPWVNGVVNERMTYAVVFKNVFTGECFIVNNQREAAELTGASTKAIWHHIDQVSLVPINGYLFRRDDELCEWPIYSKWQLELFKLRPIKPPYGYLVVDKESGEQTLHLIDSLTAWMKKSPSAAQRAVHMGVSGCGRYAYIEVKPEGHLPAHSPCGQ